MKNIYILTALILFLGAAITLNAQRSEVDKWYSEGIHNQNVKGNHPVAIRNYKEAIKVCEESAPFQNDAALEKQCINCYFNIAVCYELLEKFEEAIPYYSTVLEKQPRDHEVYARRGDCYIYIQQNLKAVADLRRAYDLAQSEWDRMSVDNKYWYTHDLAIAYKNVEKWDLAIEFISMAIALKDSPEIRLERAKYLLKKGKTKKALREIAALKEKISAVDYQFIDKYVTHKKITPVEGKLIYSLVAAEKGNWEKALELADEAESVSTSDKYITSTIYLHRANVFYRLGYFEDAIGECGRIIELQKDHVLAMSLKGLAHLQEGQRAESQALFANTAVRVSTDPLVQGRRAWHEHQVSQKEVMNTLQFLVENNPNQAEIRYYLAEVCYSANKFDARFCLENLNETIVLAPQMSEPLALKARILQEMPDLEDYKPFLNRCKELEIKHNYAAMHLSQIYKQLQDEGTALAYSKLALRDEESTLFQRNYGEVLMSFNEWSSSIKHFDYCLKVNNKDWKALKNRAISYAHTGRNKKALRDLDEAISIHSKDIHLFNERGKIYALFGNYDKADADFAAAIELHPNFTEAYFRRAKMQMDKREYDNAYQLLLTTLRVADSDPTFTHMGELYNEVGLCLVELGDLDKALAFYTQGIQLQPSPMLYENRAKLYTDINQHHEAIEDYKVAVQYDNSNAENYFLMGASQYETTQYKEAANSITISINIYIDMGEDAPLEYYKKRGDSYFQMTIQKQGDYMGLAEADFKKYQAAKPHHWQPLYYLGKCRYEKQDYEKAVQFFQDAIQIDDQHEEVFVALGDAFSMLEQFANAAFNYGKASDLNPKEICYIKKKGHAHLRDENWIDAIKDYNSAIQQSQVENITVSVELYHGLGRAYTGKGYVEDNDGAYKLAVQNYERALDIENLSDKQRYFIRLNMMTMYEKRGMEKEAKKIRNLLTRSEPFRDNKLLRCG